MILALRLWMGVLALVMLAYAIRHLLSTITRVGRQQRTGDAALLDQVCPGISVLIPMHDDEAVAEGVLTALVQSDYPKERLEIIPIDDHSQDATPEILERYRAAHPFIKPVYRRSGPRGKPAALNDALALASHEIVIVFDAGHLPTRGVLRELARAFQDPEVGGVVGRVFPRNTSALVLTRLLEPERAGGHQVDQQARYTLDPISRFGGTMGGFRRSLALAWGGFDPRVLAEDTDLTFRLYTRGWRIAYVNRAECYEEVPEAWDVRHRQLRRWARGHTQVMFRHGVRVLRSPYLTAWQKLDGALLLGICLVPALVTTGLAASLILFLTGSIPVWAMVALGFFVVAYNAFGNFAPFYQAAAAGLLDGIRERLFLLPFLSFIYLFNTWAVTSGFVGAVLDLRRSRMPEWDATRRFRR